MSSRASVLALAGLVAGSQEPQFRGPSGYFIRRRDNHIIGPMYSGSKVTTRSKRRGRGASDPGSHLHAGFRKRERNRRRLARLARMEAKSQRIVRRIIEHNTAAFGLTPGYHGLHE